MFHETPIFGKQPRLNPFLQFIAHPIAKPSTHPYLVPLHMNTPNLKVNHFLCPYHKRFLTHRCLLIIFPAPLPISTYSTQPGPTACVPMKRPCTQPFTIQLKFYHSYKVYPELLCLEVTSPFLELVKHSAPLLQHHHLLHSILIIFMYDMPFNSYFSHLSIPSTVPHTC